MDKQTIKFEKPLPHLAHNIKRVQANHLSDASPKTIRKSTIFWQLQRVQKSNNPFKGNHG